MKKNKIFAVLTTSALLPLRAVMVIIHLVAGKKGQPEERTN